MSIAHRQYGLIPDFTYEQAVRDAFVLLDTKILAAGFTAMADTGQVSSIYGAYLRAPLGAGSSYAPRFMLDNSGSTGYFSNIIPMAQANEIIYDAGVGNTFNAASEDVITTSLDSDIREDSLWYTDAYDPFDRGAATWTQIAYPSQLARSSTTQNRAFTSPGAHRFFRKLVTGTHGFSSPTTALGIMEWALKTSGAVKNTINNFAPTFGGAVVGYKMYQFADWYGQNGTPFVIKLELLAGSSLAVPAVAITIGTGSNGAGTVTGQVCTRQVIAAPTSSLTPMRCAISGETVNTSQVLSKGRINACMFYSSTSVATTTAFWFNIERIKDSTGKDTADGVIFCGGYGSTTKFFQVIPTTGTVPAAETDFPVISPLTLSSGARGNTFHEYPLTPHMYKELPQIHGAMIGFAGADAALDLPITINVQGVDKTYLPLPYPAQAYNGGNAIARVLLLHQ